MALQAVAITAVAVLTCCWFFGTLPTGLKDHTEGMAMWRVIIRIGYFNDVGSRLRGRVVQFFNNMGLHNTATGTFESTGVPRAQAAAQLTQVLQAIADPQQYPEVNRICELKHLWMYIDRA
jgi:hypothetical protein